MINFMILKKSTLVLASVYIICIIVNILSWNSTAFSDWHRSNVFPVVQGIFSRISGIFPFSLGEIMIALGIFLLTGGIAAYVIIIMLNKGKRKKITYIFGKTVLWLLAFILAANTSNFFILYHCSGFAEVYNTGRNEYTPEQLYYVAEAVIEKANAASAGIARDENNNFILTGDYNGEAKRAMKKLGEEYPSLRGYYPEAKPVFFSGIMTKFNLLGIYFPFSMEANYNGNMHPLDIPSTICHELAHLKGWMPEDEANFISFLACVNSDNPDFVYSGYVSAMEYLWIKVDEECGLGDKEYAEFVNKIDAGILNDCFRSHEIFRKAKEEPLGSVMAEVSDTAIEASLKLNGVEDGAKSYGRFVDLLLNYYLDENGLLKTEPGQ